MLTEGSLRHFTAHVASARTAMAGATIAVSGALGCSLGEACVRISRSRLEAAGELAAAQRVAARLSECRGRLEALADEDGAAITGFETLRDAGEVRQAQDRLCRMPLEMGSLAAEAASLLQEFRPLVRGVQDDLEMAITLLAGAARAATLLLDSNLRIWPEPALLATYEPELSALRMVAGRVQAAERVRQ